MAVFEPPLTGADCSPTKSRGGRKKAKKHKKISRPENFFVFKTPKKKKKWQKRIACPLPSLHCQTMRRGGECRRRVYVIYDKYGIG